MEFVLIQNLSELRAENCGIAILNPGWIHRKRKISTSVFILGYQGEVWIQEETECYSIRPSSFCILSAGRQHWGIEELNEKAKYYWIHFETPQKPEFLSESEAKMIIENEEITKARLNDALLLPRYMNFSNTISTRESFHELLYEQEHQCFTQQKYQYNVRLMLINLNSLVIESLKGKEKCNNKSIVNKIIQTIYENLTDSNFSVKTLADYLGYNPDYLNRHFKGVMKKSLSEFILDKRIDYSLTQLRDSDETISNIASATGFSSYRNFIHQFKQRKTATPTEYRNWYRNVHITNK